MRSLVKYDRSIDAWLISGQDVTLRSREDVTAWRARLWRELDRLGGEKAVLVLDLDGFEVEIGARDAYGAMESEMLERYALALLRFGEPEGFTRTVILLESEKRGLPRDIYASRAAVVRALTSLRQHAALVAANDESAPLAP